MEIKSFVPNWKKGNNAYDKDGKSPRPAKGKKATSKEEALANIAKTIERVSKKAKSKKRTHKRTARRFAGQEDMPSDL